MFDMHGVGGQSVSEQAVSVPVADLLVGLSERGDKHVELALLCQAVLDQPVHRRLLTEQQERIACMHA